jgi:GntR family transcriptional regulator, rspAB operon transcriptional repressor
MSAGGSTDRARINSEASGLADEAYLIVRERIIRGELAPGQVISRRKIAAELGMSFLPVSEALLRLEHDGLLESRPRAGTRVRVPTRADVEGHYTVREALEVQAAMLFAERASREERAELMRLAARVDSLYQQQDGNRHVYFTLHAKLHCRISQCARCEALTDAISRTCALASTWLCGVRPPMAGNAARHESLMKVLTESDPQTAAEAMREHVRTSRDHYLRSLEPFFQQSQVHRHAFARTPKNRICLEALSGESEAAVA